MARAPGEGALLALAMLSGLFYFLGRIGTLWYGPDAARMAEEELLSRVGAEFAGGLIFRTLMLYGVAALLHWAVRAGRGTGAPRDTRAALFWAAAVAAPIGLAGTMAALALPPLAAEAALRLGDIALLIALAPCLAEAHGFRRSESVLLALVLCFGGLALGVRYAASGGF